MKSMLNVLLMAGCVAAYPSVNGTQPLRCDPADSWLAYSVMKGGGKPITRVNVSWVVPANPTDARSPSAPGWWYGVEPEPACDLIQPILAYGYKGNEYSIFNGEFDWNGGGWWASDTQRVVPGDTVYSSLELISNGKEMRMIIGKKGGDPPVVSVRSLSATTPYTDLYFVVEHQPSSCKQYPADGKITFENIYVELDGQAHTPEWEQVKYKDACDCVGKTIDPKTIEFTWDTQ
eukprot:TRINITY_DN380_c8_g1_i1.p1 TRINITY_DN380_c8_g1~~TRINITY_DN380_c8_g1_i1.p1  ORF type:complete len:233 (+),score=52.02 TRINITY_DN380_c8_g1_i1:118-816(+)